MLPEVGPGPVAIKVCGLTTPGDVAACAGLGIWGIGVVFAADSPRRVDLATAAAVVSAVPPSANFLIPFVGTVVNSAYVVSALKRGRSSRE